MQRTLSIVKPDGVKKNLIGELIGRFEKQGFRIVALKMIHMSKREAEGFYIVHKARPFYGELTTFMSEGPVVVMAIEGNGVIDKVRELMGATNPKDAAPGTIRADFADNVERNIVHGSDSAESASFEIPYFFSALEIVG
ncbi:nucleoside-diphosphate kinase [Candidatus Magnetomonas plexicatena]|uniref:nucleoside-diphosphate kinase n=1 Tax=Candidatus Magnetomonas plexicatena TaxID=2552947 RepID=UPI001C771E09|nr:nucleoside-diphosphate kinase [Nitrospirales bacterium LBB_01]